MDDEKSDKDAELRRIVADMREVFDEIVGEEAVASTIKDWADRLDAVIAKHST